MLTAELVQQIENRLREGGTRRQVARLFNVSRPTVDAIAAQKHPHQLSAMPPSDNRAGPPTDHGAYLPPAERIACYCALFKSRSRRRRRRRWRPPVVSARLFDTA
jgi:hypothetical protein